MVDLKCDLTGGSKGCLRTYAAAVFHWASQGRVSLPWEARALEGLELPKWVGLFFVRAL